MVSPAAMISVGNDASPSRLAAFSRVATTDIDEAADSIGRIFCPHALDPIKRSWPDFHALHNCAAFDGFSVNYVSYGGAVSIDPGCLDRFFLLQVPLRGRAEVSTGGCRIDAMAGRAASLLSPTMPTRMIWQDDCAKLILLVDRQRVEDRAAALAERPVGAIEFDAHVDLAAPLGRALQSQIEHLAGIAEQHGPARQVSPVMAATLRESILGLLLTGQPHNHSDAVNRSAARRDPLPASFKRARDYLEAHAGEPLDVARLAQAAGIGIRSLQIGFRRHFGASISDALLEIRLTHLHRRLRDAQPNERITDIAFDLGFTHLSRMASVYRARYDESPSDTLRRSR